MSETKHVTADMVLRGIQKLSEESPGVYERKDGPWGGCVNVETVDGVNVPSCIVGSFFVKEMGADVDEMPKTGAHRSLIKYFARRDWTFEDDAITLLGIAQKMQDTKKISWEDIADCLGEIACVVEDHGKDITVLAY